jgi:hypothetical protein
MSWDDHSLADLQQLTRGTDAASRLLRGYDPDLIPGQLQTRDYATAVLRICQETSGRPMDEHDLEEAVSARMARQADWRAHSGEAHFLIAEQALYTTVGFPQVMVASWKRCTRFWKSRIRPRCSSCPATLSSSVQRRTSCSTTTPASR